MSDLMNKKAIVTGASKELVSPLLKPLATRCAVLIISVTIKNSD